MKKIYLLLMLCTALFIASCAHPNPRGALDEMVGTVGGAYRNISTTPSGP